VTQPSAPRREDMGVVGILAGRSPIERYSLHAGYVDSVAAVGGFPLILPTGPGIDQALLRRQLLRCDALLVSGGVDVDPSLSQIEDPSVAVECDLERDLLEIDAVMSALSAGQRVLGICRGIQIINVAFGGSLIGDLDSVGFGGHNQIDRQYEPVHGIEVESGTTAELVLAGASVVNSAHHQAVAEVGEGLIVSARASDGTIEAIESGQVLGIQWHPERLSSIDPLHLAPFHWLLS
jgi:putative glutamine amidotransferase